MPILTSADISTLTVIADGEMQDGATIRRTVLLDDEAGGVYPDPNGPDTTDTPCQFWAIGGAQQSEQVAAEAQIAQRGSYRMALPLGTDVRVTDEVSYLGVVYNVVWVQPASYPALSTIIGLEEAPL